MIKFQISVRMTSIVISDVTASVYSEKTSMKKLMMMKMTISIGNHRTVKITRKMVPIERRASLYLKKYSVRF